MKRIDIHTHILPPEVPDFNAKTGYPGWLTLEADPNNSDMRLMMKNGQLFRKVEKNCYDIDTRLKEMDETS